MKVNSLDLPERIRKDFTENGITDLNPPQQDSINSGLLDGRDMVVASPTASGKTLIAEMAISKQVIENNGKAIYIVPLKALASEKFQDFKDRFEEENVRISVGDLDDEGKGLDNADIIVATSEKLDSLLRHNPSWIHDVGLVVVDEIHLITSPERGPTLEVTIARLRELLDFQLLGLSATISNSNELAEWLDAELVESRYRPVDLKHGIYWNNEIEYFTGDEEMEKKEGSGSSFKTGSEIMEKEDVSKLPDGEKETLEDVHGRGSLNIIEDTLEMDKQAIVFCSSRKGSEKSSDRAGKITETEITRGEKSELEDYADRIENALGNPTTQCKRLAQNVRKGAAFHHAGLVTRQRNLVEEAFEKGLIKTVSATPTLAAGVNLPAFRVIMRDLKRYTGQGMEYIPTLEYEQMSGRAGRPKYDDRGEAISVAKKPGMRDEILERYILGDAEKIQSKLAAEPVLRMHTLSLIASGFCTSMKGLLEFYSETLYAHQYGDIEEVEQKVKAVVETLRDFDFIKEDEFEATRTGKRVSELYIDPESAHHMIGCLSRAEDKQTKAISYLVMITRTTEIRNLRVKDKEYDEIGQALMDAEKYLLEQAPNEWDIGYDSFLEAMKTAMMLKAWISELDEERIMEKYDTAPGGVRAKTQNADWLLYGARELARIEEIDGVQNDLKKLRIRLKHGIEEELLNLVKYDQIGRVRARKLHDHGIKDQEEIREVSFEKLKKLIGKRTARKLKKQVGEENIFDRENITDYF